MFVFVRVCLCVCVCVCLHVCGLCLYICVIIPSFSQRIMMNPESGVCEQNARSPKAQHTYGEPRPPKFKVDVRPGRVWRLRNKRPIL